MAATTTSLKLPAEVRTRALAAARREGVTPHAFMVEAIRTASDAAAKRAEFIAQAVAARRDALRSGKGYAADDVHAYLRQRLRGAKVRKPGLKAWRG
ncbi:MAG TPA: CopG family transcriptional regulator [Rudaea sp.]|jgi:hypothetical protein|nr:CopG family transcriptional regulator [Rudaea sp.]